MDVSGHMEQSSAVWRDLAAIDRFKYRSEEEAVAALFEGRSLHEDERHKVAKIAARLVERTRQLGSQSGIIERYLQQFSLATEEGIALMCIAEALLRIPDPETRDRLIAERVGSGDWGRHLGQSDSLLVNASSWGLLLTGKLVRSGLDIGDPPALLSKLTQRLGEPVIRQAITTAVGIMGNQFVLGTTIKAALARAKRGATLCSFDMLGEGARTMDDAERYRRIYAEAIEMVGKATKGQNPESGHGISVKLSALHPRFEATQMSRVHEELYPVLLDLARLAAHHDLSLTIDAEEADRLIPTLELFERLANAGDLAGWTGLGIVVQAYQKRALAVIDELHRLAKRGRRRLMVRLVKGAYWDSEIKRAQVEGHPDYPVYTTKAATDVSYLVCARKLIAASPQLYPQLATHNANTLAAVRLMAEEAGTWIEHQRLHGMGAPLYRAAEEQFGPLRLRCYAPVGGHQELLPYLVRRLLENGANTSFVHTLLDARVPAELLAQDPFELLRSQPARHPKIPLPAGLYGPERANPPGRDFAMASTRQAMCESVDRVRGTKHFGGTLVGGVAANKTFRIAWAVTSPPDHARVVGEWYEASGRDIDDALIRARAAHEHWSDQGGTARARVLRAMGDALEGHMDELIALLAHEAGKTLTDGVAEVREAIDFCRYYAHLAEEQFSGSTSLKGPVGETNELELVGRGVFVCISPWNFPLAIFTGQIAAALAAGNAVIAKPAEQTSLIASKTVKLFHDAGLHPDLLSLICGDGSKVGAQLVAHPGIDGVAFTGGTDTAFAINRTLAAREGPMIPFIAETGGLNAMFVDTTALREQVIDDSLQSAFGSAGQRCSALRMLYLPETTADEIIEGLIGAAQQLVVGDPADPATDVGPVIDAEARRHLEAHVERLSRRAKVLYRKELGDLAQTGHFFGPVIAEVPTPDFLDSEVFGPILHIYRYRPDELEGVARKLAARRYALTLGIHSRIGRFARRVRKFVPAGNTYVNRSMTGAVVGVQPFGGEGLSGTGPKAGGPHALLRYASERVLTVDITAQGGDPALMNL